MFSQRNHEHQPMLEIPIKQVTPIRNRAPTPIHKMPLKIMQNKQNNPGIIQTDHLLDKPMLNQERNKKPLISPVRNPFKQNIQKEEQYSSNQFAPRNNTSQNFYENQLPHNNHFPNMKSNRNNNGYNNFGFRENVSNFQEEANCCVNHPNKNPQYISYIDDNQILYCGKCAAQLASQGFQVKKIQPTTVKKGDTHRTNQAKPHALTNHRNQKKSSLPRYPEYEGNQKYQMIMEFLNQLKIVEEQHQGNMQKLQNIDQHYSAQIENASSFYDELVDFLQQMKEDHIADLEQEQRKHSQIAIIEHDYLRQNIDEMNSISNDIEQNLENIVEKLEESDLQTNLIHYRQKIQVYRHKTEEQAEFFEEVIDFSPEEIAGKLEAVQGYLMDVWNQPKKKKNQDKEDQRNLYHQNEEIEQNRYQNYGCTESEEIPEQRNRIPSRNFMRTEEMQLQQQGHRGNSRSQKMQPNFKQQQQLQKNQSAFRQLFDDQDALLAETSPQFKKI